MYGDNPAWLERGIFKATVQDSAGIQCVSRGTLIRRASETSQNNFLTFMQVILSGKIPFIQNIIQLYSLPVIPEVAVNFVNLNIQNKRVYYSVFEFPIKLNHRVSYIPRNMWTKIKVIFSRAYTSFVKTKTNIQIRYMFISKELF